MARTLRLACVLGACGLAVCSCSGSKSPLPPTAPSPTVSSVAVSGSPPAMGTSAQFIATATLSNGTTQDVSSQATWQSSNTAVLTVSDHGVVTAVGIGEVEVRATYQGLTGLQHVSVAPPAPCTFAVSPTSVALQRDGGSATLSVTTTQGANCTLTAASNASFITIMAIGSGSSGGTVTFVASANSGSPRSGTLTVGGQSVTVTQDGVVTGNCVTAISPTTQNFGENGPAPGSVAVTAPGNCNWTATSNAAFLTITGGGSGTGNGTVSYSVAANAVNAGRSGTISIGGHTFTVTQDGRPCSMTVSPTSLNLDGREWGHALNPLSLTITASSPSCAWTVMSDVGWIVPAIGSGVGSGSPSIKVAQNNTGDTRAGTIVIVGQSVPVTQTSLAKLSLSLSATTVGSSATRISFTVVASGSNTGFWWVSTSSPFFHVNNPCISRFDCTGSLTGSVDIDENQSTSARTGTLTLNVGRANLVVPLVTYAITQSAK